MRLLGPLFSCLLFLSLLATAQERDPHFLTPRLAPTAHRSAFLHGYLHGYEEGFHEADFDLHMGKIGRGEFGRESKAIGYRKQFGPKSMYEGGFHEGFRVGYADAAAGRTFRAIGSVEAANESDDELDNGEKRLYDEGVRSGYLAGQHQGLDDARGQRSSSPSPQCPLAAGQQKQVFCAAYVSGYGIGYSDGFINQTKTVVAEAK